jgi:hypothetical protein
MCIIQNYLTFSTNTHTHTHGHVTGVTFCLLQDSNMERVILVSPKFGISQITGLRNSVVGPNTLQNQMFIPSQRSIFLAESNEIVPLR